MRQQTQAVLLALATVSLWSTVATAFKLSLRYLPVPQLLLLSGIVSVAALALLLAVQGKLGLVFRLSGRELLHSAFQGLLNPFAYYLILFTAYDLLPAQEAQPLNYTWAITLSLLSVPLLGHRLRPADGLALLISYCGVYVISTRGELAALSFSEPLGVALALLSTVIWALYWILNTRDTMDAGCRLLLNFAFGTLFLALVVPFWSGLPAWDPAGWAGAAYIGLFEMSLPFFLWSLAMKKTDSAARIGIFIYLSPFLSLIFIHRFVGETILGSTIAGLVLIVIGIGLQQVAALRERAAAR
jgi:drug/metabolite transporter (DMT)-like permease